MRDKKTVQKVLSGLPSVDEILKGPYGIAWLTDYPRKYVREAVRDVIELRRKEVLADASTDISPEGMVPQISSRIETLASPSLRQVINATGVVIHTNLGRSVISERAAENVRRIATGYSNLEYDIDKGVRGKRYAHIKRLLREVTGAEDGFAVNNNAAAVLLCLSAIARGREVIISRGELVEIGGSFRIPDVMVQSNAVLREVGTTNKTHPDDYKKAINENTGLILKVHQSNYRITGFTEDVSIERLSEIGRENRIPVMYDLGSGCLLDLKPFGIHSEPNVSDILKSGVDIVTFSGDKLLGGPQAGLIVGNRQMIEHIQKNPLTRALRIDKFTLAALEATLYGYLDIEKARDMVPTLKMLLEDSGVLKTRAKKIASLLKKEKANAVIDVIQDSSQAGGGSLPEISFPTYVITIKPKKISVNNLEERLRRGEVPVIARIREDSLILDARTISDKEASLIVKCVKTALG